MKTGSNSTSLSNPAHVDTVTAFAPASVANVAVGFDCLGFAFSALGDEVTVKAVPSPDSAGRVSIEWVPGGLISGILQSLQDPEKNTATRGVTRFIQSLSQIKALNFDLKFQIKKGIPLGSGLGGSAASAVAGSLASAELLFRLGVIPAEEVRDRAFEWALQGEELASGSRHADNVGPSLVGGLCLVNPDPVRWALECIHLLPIPKGLWAVVVHPGFELRTEMARKILTDQVDLKKHVRSLYRMGRFMEACHSHESNPSHQMGALREILIDEVIEPQRSQLIPGFERVKAAALSEGAIGCSISGAGPSVFAWVESEEQARRVEKAIKGVWNDPQRVRSWIAPVGSNGARVLT